MLMCVVVRICSTITAAVAVAAPRLKVRVSVDVECYGHACRTGLGESDAINGNAQDEWCELLLSQYVPRGAYIDVDEVKVTTNQAGNWQLEAMVLVTVAL